MGLYTTEMGAWKSYDGWEWHLRFVCIKDIYENNEEEWKNSQMVTKQKWIENVSREKKRI